MSRTGFARSWRVTLLVASLAFIVVATLTPGSPLPAYVPVPDFWCVACDETGGADLTANIALFVPLGVSLGLLGTRPVRALGLGTLLSVGVECAQGLGHPAARVANFGDILTNAAGTLTGAVAAYHGRSWLWPSARVAGTLAAAATVAVCGLSAFTAWALGPLAEPTQSTALEASALPFTPGFGWFHGRVSVVRVGASSFPHAGDGPVILRGTIAQTLAGEVRLSGQDERRGFVPILFVHDAADTRPALMLGQRGTSATLSVRLRASRLRLPGPALALHNAFGAGPDSTRMPGLDVPAVATDADSVRTVRFAVTPAVLALTGTHGATVRHAALPVSMALGWTLFQTVLHTGTWKAQLMSLAWMCMLALPVGYWCTWAGTIDESHRARRAPAVRIARPVALGAALLGGALWLIPPVGGIAACSPGEWTSAICGFASGVFFAAQALGNRPRLEAVSHDQERLSPPA